MSDPPLQRRRHAWLILGGVVAGVALLALVEIVLRWCGVAPPDRPPPLDVRGALVSPRDTIVWDRDLLYRFAPNFEFLSYYRTNSRGYRGPEFAATKDPAVVRIVCVGDSCVFGLGLREEDTIPRQLELALDSAYAGALEFEVLNLGVVGYSTYQSRRQIETEVTALAPDVVLYLPTLFNDATYAAEASDERRAVANRGLLAAMGRLRLARLLGVGTARYELPARIELAAEKDATRARVPLADVARHATSIFHSIAAMGARSMVAISALESSVASHDASLAARRASLVEVARGAGVSLVDVGANLRGYSPYSLLPDGVHPDRDGARVIARAIFGALVESEILPKTPRTAFLRELLRQRERGAYSRPQWDPQLLADGLPVFRELLAITTRGVVSPGDTEAARASFERFDPVVGRERSRYGVGRVLVATKLGVSVSLPGVDLGALESWLTIVEREVEPRDLFARHLWGALAVGGPPPSGAIALARAATILEHELGLAEPVRDRRLGFATRSLEAGDPAGCIAATDVLLALAPNEPRALTLRAQALRRLGRDDEAKATAAQAVASDARYAPAAALAAILAFEGKDFANARELLDRALAEDPFAIDCRYARARLAIERGDVEAARADLFAVLAIDRDSYPDALESWRSLPPTRSQK